MEAFHNSVQQQVFHMDDRAKNMLDIEWKHKTFTFLSTQQNNSIFIASVENILFINQRQILLQRNEEKRKKKKSKKKKQTKTKKHKKVGQDCNFLNERWDIFSTKYKIHGIQSYTVTKILVFSHISDCFLFSWRGIFCPHECEHFTGVILKINDIIMSL